MNVLERSLSFFLEFYPSSSRVNAIFEEYDQVPKRQKCSHRKTYHNRVIDLKVQIPKHPLRISLVIFGHPVNQACQCQGHHQSQNQIVKYFLDWMLLSDCVCGDDSLADGAFISFDEPVVLGGDFVDETIFVDELETALAGTGRIDERIIVFVSLLQTNPALLFGWLRFWVVRHNINRDESSLIHSQISIDPLQIYDLLIEIVDGRQGLLSLNESQAFFVVLPLYRNVDVSNHSNPHENTIFTRKFTFDQFERFNLCGTLLIYNQVKHQKQQIQNPQFLQTSQSLFPSSSFSASYLTTSRCSNYYPSPASSSCFISPSNSPNYSGSVLTIAHLDCLLNACA